jgi:Xylose isomerase-like TIM barrel
MPSSERIIGFSTGAIAKGDFRRALDSLSKRHVPAVELSALREQELPQLMSSLKDLDLRGYSYVSVHAPTKLDVLPEQEIVRLLEGAASFRFPIVVHPDTIQSPNLWKSFGPLLLVENMDKRKPIGRTVAELRTYFDKLPDAGLCFDVAHARQVDPSMIEAAQILRVFGDRLREVHASGVTTRSVHAPISDAGRVAYESIAGLIHEKVPIILESPVEESMISEEIKIARSAFSPWLERLRADIDDVLDLKIDSLRKYQAENFFKLLQMTHISLSNFEAVVSQLPTGGGFAANDVLFTARDLLDKLSEDEKLQLKLHLFERARDIAREYPDLKSAFREQFARVE